ncbi:MAG: dihydrolipoyl dehydrogenase [Thermodesulfovibrionales bacterium]|nr:dihydrolipoyl dehydrogenase [Thermodesulfovibrionales bacterium]
MRIAIIGAGPGGYIAALKAAQLGAKINIIEQDEVGGTCLNWGCIPTKAILSSVEAFHKAQRLSEFGIDFSGELYPNPEKIIDRKNKVVAIQVKGIRALFKNAGVNLIEGRAKLVAPNKIEIYKKDTSVEIVEADKIIISTGSKPASLTSLPFDGEYILSSNDALSLKSIPKSILIIGAGAIGCEFASIFAGFGADVTLLELMPRILPTEDYEISELLQREFKKRKIKVLTGLQVEKINIKHGLVEVDIKDGRRIVVEKVLVSVGRIPNTENLGLEELGIRTSSKGHIVVNDRLETNVKGIYAIGDVVGGILLAHKASEEGIVSALNACGKELKIDYSVIPSAIFTSPEIGSVGLRQHEIEKDGIQVKVGRSHFRTLGKAHAMGEISGFFKLIADVESDRLVGAHVIGPNATELIHEASLAIKGRMKVSELSEMVHAHPTLAEGFREAAFDLQGCSLHTYCKK